MLLNCRCLSIQSSPSSCNTCGIGLKESGAPSTKKWLNKKKSVLLQLATSLSCNVHFILVLGRYVNGINFP